MQDVLVFVVSAWWQFYFNCVMYRQGRAFKKGFFQHAPFIYEPTESL